MGLFKKPEDAHAQATAVESTDVDPDDPVLDPVESSAAGVGSGDPFAPIEGVDIDTYARVQGLIGKNMIMGPENVETFAAENGIPEGTWQAVVLGWQERIQKYPHVQRRFGVVLSQHAI